MKPYCMTVVKYVLPAMRVLIMNELIEEYGLRKVDVAEEMSLSPAAITQYIKGERGSGFLKEISESKEAIKKISEISRAIARDEAPMDIVLEKMCEVCRLLRIEGVLCKLHKEESQDLKLSECKLCLKEESERGLII